MKINFVLPFFAKVPGGGTKVMYEYANRLANIGHDIAIYHLVDAPYFEYYRPKFLRKLINIILYRNIPQPDWFEFNKKITLKFADCLDDNFIRDADATIITWWSLVEPLSRLSKSKGKKINLIQDYEDWTGHVDLLEKSYQFKNISKIGISPFVIEKVKEYDEDIHYIPNAIDNDKFSLTKNFNDRKSLSFCMMYSNEPRKASTIGLQAFEILKEKYKDLKVTLFSTYIKPINLPDWIDFIHNPKHLNQLYNEHRYFVTNSISEGWGLPAHEAMACGNILICTKIKGHEQFYNHFEGVVTYEAGSVKSLVDQIEKIMILSEDKQLEISKKNEEIKEVYNWDKALHKLIEIIENEQ